MNNVENAVNELSSVLQKYQVLESLPEVKVAYLHLLRALAGARGEAMEQEYWKVRLDAVIATSEIEPVRSRQ